ncbi:MAG: Ig-like domain-containing protein [Paludibacteraceae bacterium]|nr:Ig-like domain-containing protein [Paludibacteraceae bacterium]
MRIGNLRKLLYCLAALAILAGCANRGIGPQGGPKDSIPPVPLRSVPEIGALNFKDKRIEVTFDEYIQLNNIAGNLLMSPPQQNAPDVRARGKRLIINFQDSLRDSTTYTIDFGDAVCDFRERVPLHGFSFYFSTGDEIDTLEYTGMVYDAATLNPMQGILVGIHRDLSDSALTKQPFLRIAKTDSTGYFRIGNIHPGKYRLYAVDDFSRDNRLTPGEAMGFADEEVTIAPRDTADSAAIVEGRLFLFKEAQEKLYLQRTLRDEQHRIRLLFSSSPDSVLSWRAMRPSEVDSTKNDSAWVDPTPYIHMVYTARRDTVTLWLTDSVAIRQDSIFLEARYRRTDSVFDLEWYTDTLRAVWRAPRMTAKAKEQLDRKNRNRRLELKSNARKGFELYDTLSLSCTTPIHDIAIDSIHLFLRRDTVYTPVPFEIMPYDTLPMKLLFRADLNAGEDYELRLDSGALTDVYGVSHIAGTYALTVKTPADYSTLRVKLKPFVPQARIQILDSKDQVVRELPATEEGAFFEHLKPDSYYMRLYLDENGDGKWTTGSWENHRQPEAIYYFPGKIQTKSNWDFEEEWDYQAVEQMQAKPKELIKVVTKK